MNARIENNGQVVFTGPCKVRYTKVTGTEDVEVNGVTVKRLTGETSERIYTADEMNALGMKADDRFSGPHWRTLEYTKEAYFHKASYNASIRGDIDGMKSAMANLADSFFEGGITEEGLAEKFQRLAEKFIGTCREKQYPFPMLCGMDEAELSFAYDCFRGGILKSAVQHNNAEGKALTSKYNSGWHYYNAKYYYMSERAIGAISDKVNSMAADRGFDEFQIPDYLAIGKNSLYNFSSAVSGESDYIPGGLRAIEDKWIQDFDAVPPEDFKWFYEAEGHDSQTLWVREVSEPEFPRLKSKVWAAYKGMLASNSFMFSPSHNAPSDLKNLGDLLEFRSKVKDDVAAVNSFLKNFQVSPRGYFLDMARQESGRRNSAGWNVEA